MADTGNRWFDKSYSVIVGSNGCFGVNIEHSAADGGPLLRVADYLIKPFIDTTADFGTVRRPLAAIEQLHWVIPASIQQGIALASSHADQLIQQIDLKTFNFTHHTKTFMKHHNLSPDAYFQMAIQLAYYRLVRNFVGTYETAQTRQFYHGRTETIRVCSAAAHKFVLAMDNSQVV